MAPSGPILFLSLTDDVGCERIVSDMGRKGARCLVMARPGSVAALSRHVEAHLVLPSRGGTWFAARGVAAALEQARATSSPAAVLPLDDMAARVLRLIACSRRTGPALRDLLIGSLGDPRHMQRALDRAGLIETAAALGLRTPAQQRAPDLAAARLAAESIGYPLMIKRESSCGGGGVIVVRSPDDLAPAFRSLSRKAFAKYRLGRLFGLEPAVAGPPISLQAFVAGRLAIRSVACRAGRVLDGFNLEAVSLDPPVTGASTVVRPIRNAEMEATAHRLVAELGLSGIVSFDFVVGAGGRATLIEMNARPVGSGHLGSRFGHDIYGAWLGATDATWGHAPADALCGAGVVALFPKEMRRDPSSPLLSPGSDVFHDIPWDEPRIVAHYRDMLLRRHPDQLGTITRRLGAAQQTNTRRVVVPLRA